MGWDWLPSVVTGGVGLAGIVGTAWGSVAGRRTQLSVAQMQINSESRQRLQADKRDVYARVLHCFEEVVNRSSRTEAFRDAAKEAEKLRQKYAGGTKADEAHELVREYWSKAHESPERRLDSIHELLRLISEMQVVAGPRIANEARKVVKALSEEVNGSDESYRSRLNNLAHLMHEDLYGAG